MKNQFLFCLIFFSFLSYGQNDIIDSLVSDSLERASIFDFISENQVLEINIESNFDSIFLHKKTITNYLKGNISFSDSTKQKINLPIKLKPRGKYRRKICEVPPLKLKFGKEDLKQMGLNEKYKSLKLVTHCNTSDSKSEENVLKEYLAYQIYNTHSEYSLRTLLVKTNYIQSGKDAPIFSSYAILIENEKELASRFNAEIVDKMGLSSDTLEQNEANIHATFQCMIGNADWNLFFLRNVNFLKLKDQSKLFIFPFDFDFSGFVDAPYAIPNPDYKLKSTRERVFLGEIYSDAEMLKTATHFLSLKDATLKRCMDFERLPKRTRRRLVKYLKSFYDVLEEETFQEKLAQYRR